MEEKVEARKERKNRGAYRCAWLTEPTGNAMEWFMEGRGGGADCDLTADPGSHCPELPGLAASLRPC